MCPSRILSVQFIGDVSVLKFPQNGTANLIYVLWDEWQGAPVREYCATIKQANLVDKSWKRHGSVPLFMANFIPARIKLRTPGDTNTEVLSNA